MLDESDEEEGDEGAAADAGAGEPAKELVKALQGIGRVLKRLDDRADHPRAGSLEKALEGIGGSSEERGEWKGCRTKHTRLRSTSE